MTVTVENQETTLPSAAPLRRVLGAWWRPAAAGVLVALASLGIVYWALRLWHADLALPLRYSPVDDTKFYLMLVKGILDHGWWTHNSTLGAPYGQELLDYPQGGDNLNLAMIWLLGRFTGNAALVVNLFYLLTFVLTSVCCFGALRALGVSDGASGVAGVLFSLLAYHFFRGESHLLLSAYYAVPLAAYLFLRLVQGAPLFTKRTDGPRALRPFTGRTVTTVVLCLVIGSDSLYYATFAVVLIVGAIVIAALRGRPRGVLAATLVTALVVGTLGVNLAPSLAYEASHGVDHQLTRSAAQDEMHGLKLTNLVLPAPNGRLSFLNHISNKYDNAVSPGYCEACYGSLGTVGTVGFVWLGLVVLGAIVGAGGFLASRGLWRYAGAGVLIALAVGLLGGISSLLEFFVTPDIRGWNRISVFVAFFSLLAVALLLDAARGRLRRHRGGRALGWGLLLGVLVLGALDQTSDYYIPQYAADAAEYRSDAAIVAEIQQRLPVGASVFQLPYVPFPEGYPTTVGGNEITDYNTSYEQVRGYLHSTTLRWSYGAMKGRPADWPAQLAAQPLAVVVPAVAAAGFDGIWIEPAGYTPSAAVALRSTLQSMLGEAPLLSPAGDIWFFDLRPYAARLRAGHSAAQVAALRAATLTPLRASCVGAGVEIDNPSPTARTAVFSTILSAAGNGDGSVTLSYPDGHQALFDLSGGPVIVRRRLVIPPGASTIQINDANSPNSVSAAQATLIDAAVDPFASGPGLSSAPPSGIVAPPCNARS